MAVPSPCIGICKIEKGTGLCFGCARTIDEIAAWRGASEVVKSQVWAELPARRVGLGIGLHRLAWTLGDLSAFIETTLRTGRGVWSLIDQRADEAFHVGPDERVVVDVGETWITASSPRGAVRFEISELTVVLALPGSAEADGSDRIILASPRSWDQPPMSEQPTSLVGLDFPDALIPWAVYQGIVSA